MRSGHYSLTHSIQIIGIIFRFGLLILPYYHFDSEQQQITDIVKKREAPKSSDKERKQNYKSHLIISINYLK